MVGAGGVVFLAIVPVTLPSVRVGSDVGGGGGTGYGVDLSAAAHGAQHESTRTGEAMRGARVSGRPAIAAAMAMLLVAVLGLSGCNQDNTPKEYGTVTEQNFLELCTNLYYDNTDDTLAVTDKTIAADVNAPTPDQCKCQYDVYVAQMPISDFTTLNSKLKENPEDAWNSVPTSITDALKGCMSAGFGSSVPDPVDAATSTTAATAEPATTVAP
jgi:hypothetical protein